MVQLSRRTVLTGTVAAGLLARSAAAQDDDPLFKIRNNRVKQSIMGWTFNPMPTDELARHCKALGMHAMEGVDAKHYPMIRELGLKISLTGSHPFAKGPCDPANREMVIAKIKEGIDKAVQFEAPNVITFTGYRVKGCRTRNRPGIASRPGRRSPGTPRRRRSTSASSISIRATTAIP
jgi:hydroxypyruvate isomerase